MKYLRKFNTQSDRDAYMASVPLPDLPYVHLVESTAEVKFSGQDVDYPLYIKALQDLTVSFSLPYEYSMDNVTWTSPTSSTPISVNAGDVVFLRASGHTADMWSGIGIISIKEGDCNVGGNVMSMAYGADFKGKTEIAEEYYQFKRLFYAASTDSSHIIDASRLVLPATILKSYCYQGMFFGQRKLVAAPALPATTLEYHCYDSMFYGCTSLVNAPELPATTLANECYSNMFRDCTSLVNAPALPATTLKFYCYGSMFRGCTSLANAPALPATALESDSYSHMFYGTNVLPDCSNIDFTKTAGLEGLFAGTKVTDSDLMSLLPINSEGKYYLPATTLKATCYRHMFKDCTSLVTAPALPATTLKNNCYDSMFYGCTSLVNAPELPATALKNNCYSYMFGGCSKLNYIKAMFTTTPSTDYMNDWVNGVASIGTFVKNSAATWENTFDTFAIPEGWTVEYADA